LGSAGVRGVDNGIEYSGSTGVVGNVPVMMAAANRLRLDGLDSRDGIVSFSEGAIGWLFYQVLKRSLRT
jgi:hypothetical protein